MGELNAHNKNEYEEKSYFLASKSEELNKVKED